MHRGCKPAECEVLGEPGSGVPETLFNGMSVRPVNSPRLKGEAKKRHGPPGNPLPAGCSPLLVNGSCGGQEKLGQV